MAVKCREFVSDWENIKNMDTRNDCTSINLVEGNLGKRIFMEPRRRLDYDIRTVLWDVC
jgi:hypothetical protein